MDIVIFSHPSYLNSKSMPKYVSWLESGLKNRGHSVQILTSKPLFYRLPATGKVKKWLGYIDQFLIFPLTLKLKYFPENSLFVFSDQALGPWVPFFSNKNHVIHCHDFLALHSALGYIEENPTSTTGRIYQKYIRSGFRKGKNFICVSNKTKIDLYKSLVSTPKISEVVYNGLTLKFKPINDIEISRAKLALEISIDVSKGYILHVGGNQWYKNRQGVIEIYDFWRGQTELKLPLILVGSFPNNILLEVYENSSFKNDIYFLSGKSDKFLIRIYSCATAFLFPSIAEGFGWPIAEALASGVPVITTNAEPMTEVGGNAVFTIPRRPSKNSELSLWKKECALVLNDVMNLSLKERNIVVEKGINNVRRFDSELALNYIESIYQMILSKNS